jgi:hypothetical protein
MTLKTTHQVLNHRLHHKDLLARDHPSLITQTVMSWMKTCRSQNGKSVDIGGDSHTLRRRARSHHHSHHHRRSAGTTAQEEATALLAALVVHEKASQVILKLQHRRITTQTALSKPWLVNPVKSHKTVTAMSMARRKRKDCSANGRPRCHRQKRNDRLRRREQKAHLGVSRVLREAV